MLRAGGVVKIICNNWNGPAVDWENIEAAMLIHDLGNIIKMNFDSIESQKLLDKEDLKRIKELKEIRQNFVEKYGENSTTANKAIAKELKANKRIMHLLNISFKYSKIVLASNDFGEKIGLYSDLRVAPFGVLSLEGRLKEGRERYGKLGVPLAVNTLFNEYEEADYKIEKQIFECCKIGANDVNDESILPYLKLHKK